MSLAAPSPAFAEEVPEEASQPPQPSAAVMTRLCEDNGALVVLNNFGGGTVAFTVLVDNEAFGTFDLGPGSQQSHLVPVMEDQTRTIQVTVDGMSPVAATRTRDCEAAAPEPTTPAGAVDPVDTVPAGTPPPAAVQPTAVAGAAAAPDSADATLAPATDPTTPSGTLPFTGTPHIAWIALAGFGAIVAGSLAWRRPRHVRVED